MAMVDTNILLYAYDTTDLAKRDRAISVLDTLKKRQTGALIVQILGEFYVNAARKIPRPLTPSVAEESIRAYLFEWTIFDLTPVIVLQAIRDVQRYQLSYWDALIIATARANGVQTILSEDLTDGQVYGGVRVVNPFGEGFDLASLTSAF